MKDLEDGRGAEALADPIDRDLGHGLAFGLDQAAHEPALHQDHDGHRRDHGQHDGGQIIGQSIGSSVARSSDRSR